MTLDGYIPFAEIVNELKGYCLQQRTGIMYITTRKKRSAQLMLEKGEIVYIYFANKRGRDGLRLMSEIQAGKYRFQDGNVTNRRIDLPSNDEILRYLYAAAGISFSQDDLPPASPPAASMNNTPAPAQPQGLLSLTVDQKRVLEDGLAVYIGPMAAIICEDHLETVSDIRTAVESLATEIPTQEQAMQFRQEMMRKLVG